MTFQPKLLETNDGAERSNSPLISASELIPEVPDIANLAAEYDIATLVEAVKEEALDKLALILGMYKVMQKTLIIFLGSCWLITALMQALKPYH